MPRRFIGYALAGVARAGGLGVWRGVIAKRRYEKSWRRILGWLFARVGGAAVSERRDGVRLGDRRHSFFSHLILPAVRQLWRVPIEAAAGTLPPKPGAAPAAAAMVIGLLWVTVNARLAMQLVFSLRCKRNRRAPNP